MPEKLSESVTGGAELIFPDDASSQEYRLREEAVYDAEEVRDDLGNGTEVPRYGSWIPVETEQDSQAWLNAPSQLRNELVAAELESGDLFRIETLRKDGNHQSDPYLAEITELEPDQSRLNG